MDNNLAESPLSLSTLRYSESDWVAPSNEKTRTAAAQTLIDFVVTNYGHEYLGRLLQAFATESSWDTISQEIFGISKAELEREWLQYGQ